MTKFYGMTGNENVVYLGEWDDIGKASEVADLLWWHESVNTEVWWIFSESHLRDFITKSLEALGDKVIVEVLGGVADVEAPDCIPIELIDYDAL